MRKRTLIKNNVLLVFIILCIIFIFANSLLSANQSLEGSNRIVDAVKKTIVALYNGSPPEKIIYFLNNRFSDILRDCAHFIEFFILSTLVMLHSNRFNINIYKKIIYSFTFAVCIAFIDESIQLTSPGRAFQYYDIGLDALGSLTGAVIILLVLIRKRRNKKINILYKNGRFNL